MASKRVLCFTALFVVVSSLSLPHAGATSAPTMSAPADGSSFCAVSGTDFTASGTGLASSTITLLVNGTSDATTPSDASGNYSFNVDKSPGSYTLNAQQNDGSGPAQSGDVHVNVFGANDVIDTPSVTPSRISPANHDGYHDSSLFSAHVLKAGKFRFAIYQGSTLMRASSIVDATADSTQTFTWDGKDDAGAYIPDGPYSVYAGWADAENASCQFAKPTGIIVSNATPSIPSYDESPDTFYPRTDDNLVQYKNRIYFSWGTPSEKTKVDVLIYPPNSSTPLGTLTTTGYTATAGSLTWSGHRSDGSLYPAGTYTSRYRLTDLERHVRLSSSRPFNLSLQHIVAHTTTVLIHAQDAEDKEVSGCGSNNPNTSYWSYGIMMSARNCYDDSQIPPGPDAAVLSFSFPVPKATVIGDLVFAVGGYSKQNDPIFGLLRNFDTGDDDLINYVQGTTRGVRSFGTIHYARQYVSSGHHVGGDLFLFSVCDCSDVVYDVAHAQVTLTYGTLEN